MAPMLPDNKSDDHGRVLFIAAYPRCVTLTHNASPRSTTDRPGASLGCDVWNFIDAMGGQKNLCRLLTVTTDGPP